jgi:signal transduction histidine kinase
VPDAAADYNPPLTRAGHVWRTALCLIISGLAWAQIGYHQWQDQRALFWIDLAVGVLSFPLVFYRRRWPFGVAMVLGVAGAVSGSSAGPGVLAVASLATRRKLLQIIAAGATAVLASWVYSLYQPDPNNDPRWLNVTFSIVFAVAVSALGMYVGSRRELLWTLRERAREAESDRELRVGQARSAERERIAREMHDVLAHRISLVTMHAGALAYRTDLPPEQIRETAKLIQEKAHEALTDLRQVLGVLRTDGSFGDRPQPTLSDLPSLIEESTEGGMVIDYTTAIGNGTLPSEQIGRTVYRVVQEALTNARKHAVGAHVAVRLSGDAGSGVTVEIRNARRVGELGMPSTPGSGLGLVGLRERAELAGGTLTVVDEASSFSLRCWLPWTT